MPSFSVFSGPHSAKWVFILFFLPLSLLIRTFGAPPAAKTTVIASAKTFSGLEEARNALRKAIGFQREAKDLSVKFHAKVYNSALDKEDSYEGKLLVKDSTRFRLEVPGGLYLSDGVAYWEYHKQTHQVIIRKAKDLEDQPLPGDVLLRFLDSEPLALSQSKEDGKEYLELRLDPTRAMKNLDSLVVLLDKSTFAMHRISSRDVSGNEARYTILSLKRNNGIKDKDFVFIPLKGTETVDMRE